MNKTLYLFAGALLAVGASSCSSDEPGAPDVAQKDETRYLRFNIVNPTGSRAAEFEVGTDEENAVNNIIMDFYDIDGTFVYRATPNDMTWNTNTGTPTPNVGKIGSVIVSVGIEKNKKMPAYVMCYLNPVDWSATSQTISMSELRNQTRAAYSTTVSGTEYFAMNNSCYYGDDPLTVSTEKVKISGTPIDGNKIYSSVSDAAAETAAIDIYVERYAAKVKFDINKAEGSGDGSSATGIFVFNGTTKVGGSDKAYSLKFNPEFWTINADAPTMNAVKKFQITDGGGVATFAEVNDYLGTWTDWNDEGNHRSYWSCSPAFFATEFPQVTDDVIEKYNNLDADKKVAGNTTGAGVKVYDLKYYSYNQIKTNGNTLTGELTDEQKVRYALENTVGSSITSILNPKAAVPTLLIAGNYKVTYNSTPVNDATSFYIYDNGLYFKDVVPSGVTDGETIYDKLLSVQGILFVDASGTKLTKANKPSNVTLEVAHPNKAARATSKVGENLVTLQVKEVGSGLYYTADGNTYTPVTTENVATVNNLLMNQCGSAYSYTQGKCYFAIPIHHLRWSEDLTNKPINPDGSLDWAKIRVGDLGLVRNHVYNLKVQAIKGLGTGIDKLDNPIVAPMEQNLYWIKYQINILNWRVVPTQGGIIL